MNTLFIDSREPANVIEQVTDICSNSGVIDEVEVKELETADFVCGGIGIERKEASDFASSVQDRRISEQGDRMVEEFEHRYVVLEGSDLFDLQYSNIPSRSLIGQQVSLAAKRDVRLINTDGVEGTAYAVRRIVERSLKDESVGHVKTFDVETDRTDVAMLAQIEGVSAEKAEKILDQISFSELAEMAPKVGYEDAEIAKQEVMSVSGVGGVLAERVIKAFQ